MATFQAIAATGQAIIRLLADARPQPEFSTTRFELYQLSDFQDPMEEGVSFFLYRVAVNGTRRNVPPPVGPDGIRHRPPIPLDLHYIASVWAKSPVKQQRLLGWMIRQLEDVPILPTGLLNQSGPEPDVFRPNETVELILEQMSLQDWNNLWGVTKTTPPLSVGYVARMVGIESPIALSDTLVQTRDIGHGKLIS